jgi:hypothetical protein
MNAADYECHRGKAFILYIWLFDAVYLFFIVHTGCYSFSDTDNSQTLFKRYVCQPVYNVWNVICLQSQVLRIFVFE